MESLSLAFSSGWASGVNAYMVVCILGIADKIGHYDNIPNVLSSWPVLGIALFMYVFEFIADKIPYVDTTWDFISTLIRPTVGAALGYVLATGSSDTQQILSASTGGILAFIAHFIKTSTRMAINTSPEPASNIITSTIEDLLVLTVIVLAIQHPYIAAGVATVFLVASVILLYYLYKIAKKTVKWGFRKWKAYKGGLEELEELTETL